MSHQTGISCGNELKEVFCNATNSGKLRCIQVAIKNESLVCANCVDKTSDSWEEEYNDVVQNLLKEKQPSFLLYQLKSKDEWLLITYSPDDSPVREKMLYAATRATLKLEFGGGFVTEEIFETSKKDATIDGYRQHIHHKNAPPPLTYAEEEMKSIEETESKSGIGNSTRHQTVQGIEFPITENAQNALRNFKQGEINHVELNVDTEKETIYESSACTIGASDLENKISKGRAGYHIFNYGHRYGGEDVNSIIFIYSMPGYSISIKERMLYSSCKAPLINALESSFDIKLDKKLEHDCSEALSEDFLRNEIHPPEVDKKRAFQKPKAPGRKAPARRPR